VKNSFACLLILLGIFLSQMTWVSAPPSAPSGGKWTQHESVWLLTPAQQDVRDAIEDVQRAIDAYAKTVGEPAPAGIVLDKAYLDQKGELLQQAGALWALPWDFSLSSVSVRAISAEERASIREQIVAQLGKAGRAVDEPLVERMVEQAEQQLAARNEPKTVKPLSHEIAHLMFSAAVWTEKPAVPGYGSGAPDWLDEVFAVAAEDGVLTAARRQAFARAYAEQALPPLAEWFEAEHPALNAARQLVAERNDGEVNSGVYSFTAEELAAAGASDAIIFYTQARGFLDYLDATSSEPHILGAIAHALQEKKSMEAVLEQYGEDWGLPSKLEALEQSFRAWARPTP
jgi:hypothetical protein